VGKERPKDCRSTKSDVNPPGIELRVLVDATTMFMVSKPEARTSANSQQQFTAAIHSKEQKCKEHKNSRTMKQQLQFHVMAPLAAAMVVELTPAT